MRDIFEKLLKAHAEALKDIVAREDAHRPEHCEPDCDLCADNRLLIRGDVKEQFRDFRHTLAELTGVASIRNTEMNELHAFVMNFPLELP
jgi:hypothetical protein